MNSIDRALKTCFLLAISLESRTMNPQHFKAQDKKIKLENKFKFDEKEKSLVKQSCQDAYAYFKMGSLAPFDPLVGEWQCHLRAFITIKFFKYFQSGTALTKEQEEFLGLSKLLTQGKITKTLSNLNRTNSETTNYSRCYNGGATKGKSFINKCQSRLAFLTLTFMQQQAKELNDETLIKGMSISREDGPQARRVHCSFFWGFKTLLAGMLQYKIPLLIKVKEYCAQNITKHDFLYTTNNNSYDRNDNLQNKIDALMVIEGISGGGIQKSVIDSDFRKLDILEMLLIVAAHHRQFAGEFNHNESFQCPPDLEAEMRSFKALNSDKFMRKEQGGPYLFVIDHMYPSTMQKESDLKKIFEMLQKLFNNNTLLSDLIMIYAAEH